MLVHYPDHHQEVTQEREGGGKDGATKAEDVGIKLVHRARRTCHEDEPQQDKCEGNGHDDIIDAVQTEDVCTRLFCVAR